MTSKSRHRGRNHKITVSLLSDHYDIVLVDINLTTLYEQDGLTLAEEIIAEDPAVKIVMLTGYSKPMYSHRAKEMGARVLLIKY